MLFDELELHSFEKELEGAVEIECNNNIFYSTSEKRHLFKETEKPLNGKYYFSDMEQIHYYKNGKQHRDDNLPVVIGKNGSLFYYVNDKSYRIDGPSDIWSNGNYFWHINGYRIDNNVMDEWIKEHNIPLDWNKWSDNDKFLFAMHWSDYNGK